MLRIGTLLVISLLFVPVRQAIASDTCAWYRAAAAPGDWWITHGKCKVAVTGKKFTALLYDSDHPDFLRMTVSGVIQGEKVRASVETENSDAAVVKLEGTLTKGDIYRNVMLIGSGYDTIGIKFGPN